MFVNSRLRRAAGLAVLSAASATLPLVAAELPTAPAPTAAAVLPDAPGLSASQTTTPPSTTATAPGNGAQSTAAPVTPTPPANPPNYTLKKAEHQRMFGVMPEFQAVNVAGYTPPLSTSQKFHLMWKSSTDPFIFSLDGIVALIGQAKDSNPGFGQGTKGYLKRFGSSYADTFDGNFWGNAVLTSAFKEDPRYFRLGEGHSYLHRASYSALTAIWSRTDSGKWRPNFANVIGNFISGGISNLYYPAADRGLGKTATGALTVTAEGTIGSELIEFWPDISRKLFPNHIRKQMERERAADAAAAAAATAGTGH